MMYVYIIRSLKNPLRRYFGITSDLRDRLKAHNAGQAHHTAKYRPWKLDVYIGFADKQKAVAFERYLKSGSGKAFSKRRF
jgi:putative endonuclease